MFSLTSSKSFELAWNASDMNSSSWSVLEMKKKRILKLKKTLYNASVFTFD